MESMILGNLLIREDNIYDHWYPIDAKILTHSENLIIEKLVSEAVRFHMFAYPAPKFVKAWIHEMYPFDFDEQKYSQGKIVLTTFANNVELKFHILYPHDAKTVDDVVVQLVSD